MTVGGMAVTSRHLVSLAAGVGYKTGGGSTLGAFVAAFGSYVAMTALNWPPASELPALAGIPAARVVQGIGEFVNGLGAYQGLVTEE